MREPDEQRRQFHHGVIVLDIIHSLLYRASLDLSSTLQVGRLGCEIILTHVLVLCPLVGLASVEPWYEVK